MSPAASRGAPARACVPLTALLLAALLLGACAANPASTAPTVRIGLVAPFEGHGREIGYDVIYAARLAVRERNAAGGVGGYRVDLVALDDGGDPELAVRAAQSLAIDPLVMGVVGHWTAAATEAARPVYVESGLALLVADGVLAEPASLPDDFIERYEGVTPFDETAGPRAAAAYDACNLLYDAIGRAIAQNGEPDRASVAAALAELSVQGISGPLATDPLDGLNRRLVRLP